MQAINLKHATRNQPLAFLKVNIISSMHASVCIKCSASTNSVLLTVLLHQKLKSQMWSLTPGWQAEQWSGISMILGLADMPAAVEVINQSMLDQQT